MLKDILNEIESEKREDINAEKLSSAIGDYVETGEELTLHDVGVKTAKNEDDESKIEDELDDLETIIDDLKKELNENKHLIGESTEIFMAGFLAALGKLAYKGNIKSELKRFRDNPKIKKLIQDYNKKIKNIKSITQHFKDKYKV